MLHLLPLSIQTGLFFGANARLKFYQKLGAMVRNGIGQQATLKLMQKRLADRNKPMQHILAEAHIRMLNGATLSAAFEKLIPDEEYMLIKSGVDSGDVPNALELCCNLIKLKQKIIAAVRKSIGGPALLFSLVIILMLIVSRYVVPQLSLISDPTSWRNEAAMLYQFARFVDSPVGFIFFSCLTIVVMLVFATLPYFTGTVRIKLDKIPPWSVYRLIHGSIWLFTLATLLKANVLLNNVIEDSLNSPQVTRWLRERLQAVHAQLAIGKNLGEALVDCEYDFPDEELNEDLLIYASLPQFHSALYAISKEWLEDGIERIETTCKTLNISLIAVVAIFTGFIVLSVNSLQNQLGTIFTG